MPLDAAPAIVPRPYQTAAVDALLAHRARLIDAFRRGELSALCNVVALGTGFDVPAVDLIGLLRPTRSRALYYQMLGRGTRLSPSTGKADCVVLDYGGSTLRLGRIENLEWEGADPPPGWECQECGGVNDRDAQSCADCGKARPQDQRKPQSGEPDGPELSERDVGILAADGEDLPVTACSAALWTHGGIEHLRVRFEVEGEPHLVSHVMWFTEDGASWREAERARSWTRLGGMSPPPRTAREALARLNRGEIPLPASIDSRAKVSAGRVFHNLARVRRVGDRPASGGKRVA